MRSASFAVMVPRLRATWSAAMHAPGDGFAVEELLVVGGGLDGVADGVAEVEDHAQAGFFFVLADDVGFDADAGGDDVGEGCRDRRRGWLRRFVP